MVVLGKCQQLAYSTSIAIIVPQQHYIRAMGLIVHYGSASFAPALAGSLYPVVGLLCILLIDLTTFTVAIATLVAVNIPQPSRPDANQQVLETLTFGRRFIWNHRGLVLYW
jgi:DHA3 family macrolide efflux protein-like MFS transporter